MNLAFVLPTFLRLVGPNNFKLTHYPTRVGWAYCLYPRIASDYGHCAVTHISRDGVAEERPKRTPDARGASGLKRATSQSKFLQSSLHEPQ
jgi:hypothetical protein